MASSGSFCGLVRRKEVSFVVLLVQLGFVGFSRVSRVSRVSKVRVGIRVSLATTINNNYLSHIPAHPSAAYV